MWKTLGMLSVIWDEPRLVTEKRMRDALRRLVENR
jgi:hypothetical protein